MSHLVGTPKTGFFTTRLTLKLELNGIKAYEETSTDEKSVVDSQLNDFPLLVFCRCEGDNLPII